MVFYCTEADVGSRLGLNAQQRDRASSRMASAIRRAAIDIDQEFRYYGRTTPSRETAESTLDGAHAAGATTVDVASGTAFASAGNGNVDGDSFAWTGKSTNQLTGVTGLTADHAAGVTVQQGEFAHILREVCADLAAGYYLEDEAAFQDGGMDGGIRGNMLRERGTVNLRRLAHLGTVD